jgi:hypothetical protein
LVFGIFAALAEFERELIRERTIAGLAAARARGRNGGRKPKMTPAKLRLAQHALGKKGTVVADLCNELGITPNPLSPRLPHRGAKIEWKENHSGKIMSAIGGTAAVKYSLRVYPVVTRTCRQRRGGFATHPIRRRERKRWPPKICADIFPLFSDSQKRRLKRIP